MVGSDKFHIAAMTVDTVNLNNGYGYRRTLLIGFGATLITLMILVYGLRLYARRVSQASFWWDDWIMSGALVRDLGYAKGKSEPLIRGQALSIASTVIEFLCQYVQVADPLYQSNTTSTALQYGLGKHTEGQGVTKHDLKYYVIVS